MSTDTLAATASNAIVWLAGRLSSPRRSPMPLASVRGQLAAMVQTPYGATLVCAVGGVIIAHAVRTAWAEIYRRTFAR